MDKTKPQTSSFEVPPEGSLGLLALGAAGLVAWRKARFESGFEEKLIAQSKQNEIEAQKKIEALKEKQREKQQEKKQHEK